VFAADGQLMAHESFFVNDVRGWVRSRFDVALPANAPRCTAYRPARNSPSPWGFGIPMCTA
jgi:hypothetical protein